MPKNSKTEQERNRFIVGALIGGSATYLLSGNNLLLTVFGAIVVGYLATKL